MVTDNFEKYVNEELVRVRSRCMAIYDTIRALEEERDLLKECEETLAILQDRYDILRQNIENARKVQAHLSPTIEHPNSQIRQFHVPEQNDRPTLAAV